MKRFLAVVLIVLAVGVSTGSAQEPDPFIGGGFGITIVGGDPLVALTLQGGADDLLGPLELRGNFDIGISGSFFDLGVDLLVTFPAADLSPYVGGGFGVLSGTGTAFNVHGTGGLEFFVGDATALFCELRPQFFITTREFGIDLRFGTNYHF